MLERVAHFTILAKLGQGGMGVVFKARDTKLGRAVALKLLPPADVADPDRRARFLREARAAAAVTHPNIATVYEVGEDEAGRVYIAMELVEGRTLRERFADDGPFSVADTTTIMRDLMRGLAKAHEAGLVHRDLKPDNLMLETDGTVKVLDFGLAKMREITTPSVLALAATGEHEAITAAGLVMGTPGYMSPEQATGKEVDARTDVFALGVIFFEMLTGKLPFRGSTVGELLVSVVRDAPRDLHELAPHVPDGIVALVNLCLAKEPDDRPKDARAVLAILDKPDSVAFARTQPAPIVSTPPPAAETSAPSRWRSALFLLVPALAVALFFVLRKETPSVAVVDAGTDAGDGLLALPDPPCNEAARIEYRKGLEASRGAGVNYGAIHFDRAAKADDQCAEAHLRAALHGQFGSGVGEHYKRASFLKARLGPADRELLDAYAPLFMQEPPNYADHVRQLKTLIAKRPRDVELIIFFGYGLWGKDETGREMTEYADRVLAIDPGFSSGWQLLGAARIKANDKVGARKAFEECDRTIPTAIDCVYEEARLAQVDGRCEDMERHARTLMARVPEGNTSGYPMLARALAANDVERETVSEALRKGSANKSPERAKLQEIRLALAYGDFDGALATLAEAQKLIDGSDRLAPHAMTTQLGFEVNLELGRPEAAIAVARAFDKRQRAWSGPVSEEYGNGEEGFLVIPRLLSLEMSLGKITAPRRDAELEAWLTRRETLGDPRVRWIARYAASAQTVADSEAAVASMPRTDAGAMLPPIWSLPSALVGRALARGGRPAEGLAELKAFTQRCDRLDNPMAQTQAFVWLGEALEAAGATAEACKAYAVVRARWSDPRSVSAKRAGERMTALACAH